MFCVCNCRCITILNNIQVAELADHVVVAHREQIMMVHLVCAMEPTVFFHQSVETVYVKGDTSSLTLSVELKLMVMVMRTAKLGY